MKRAVIHSATGVIMSITIDDTLEIPPFMEFRPIPQDYVMRPRVYEKLDENNNILPATQDDIDQSGIDPVRNQYILRIKWQRLSNALDAISTDAAPNAEHQLEYFNALMDYQNYRPGE